MDKLTNNRCYVKEESLNRVFPHIRSEYTVTRSKLCISFLKDFVGFVELFRIFMVIQGVPPELFPIDSLAPKGEGAGGVGTEGSGLLKPELNGVGMMVLKKEASGPHTRKILRRIMSSPME